jgi:hypothetical protein
MRYQLTEYDCVPTTFLNSLNYLFNREDIPPEVIQRILLYSLDTINRNGEHGKVGTTGLACNFLVQWLNQFSGKYKNFCLEAEYITGDEVHLGQNNKLVRCVNNGGVALCSVSIDKTGYIYHYILCTKADNEFLYFYDPYFRQQQFRKPDNKYLEWVKDEWYYNLKVARERLESKNYERYSFGPIENREFCLIRRIS